MDKHYFGVLMAIALLFFTPAVSRSAQNNVETLEIGSQAPDFNLPGRGNCKTKSIR